MRPIRRLLQKPGHCGPVTVEMMYSFYGLSYSQDQIAAMIGDVERITARGCAVPELAQAVEQLTPDYVLLGKQYGTIADLHSLTEDFQLPAAVEWRGRFLEPDDRVWEEGHYSLITGLNSRQGLLEMIDPYAPGINLLSSNGVISVDVFLQRWWDTNPMPVDGNGGELIEVRDDQLLFVLAPKMEIEALRDLQLDPMLVATTS
jgi:hypothetical protein